MDLNNSQKEKREFLRYDYNKPVQFSSVRSDKKNSVLSKVIEGLSRNLSASGILFVTETKMVPEISSLLLLNVDHRTASICQEIENSALVVKDRLLGRVVRIEDNEDGTCGIGVAFIKKNSPESGGIAELFG